METAYPIALLILAFGLMVLEVFLPSLGLLTIAAVACFAGAIILAFGESNGFGFAILGVSVVGAPVLLVAAFKLFPSTSVGKYMILKRKKRDTPEDTLAHWDHLMGKEGVSRSSLRPSGVAEIDGERVDVVTRGELIGPGVAIRTVEIKGNRIVVRAVDEPDPEPEEEEYL